MIESVELPEKVHASNASDTCVSSNIPRNHAGLEARVHL